MRRIAVGLLLAFGLSLGLVSVVAAQGPSPYYGYPGYDPWYGYGYQYGYYVGYGNGYPGPYNGYSGWSGYYYYPGQSQGAFLRFGGGLTQGGDQGPYLRLGGGYIIDRNTSWGMPGW